MTPGNRIASASIFVVCIISACGGPPPTPDPGSERLAPAATASLTAVYESEITGADAGEWLSHGRTYDEQRFSTLASISTENADQLGLAWSFDLETKRGVEATPLVRDGVMYVTSTWNVVHALNATTGEPIWRFDPQVDRSRAAFLCCGAVNRGAALWGERVFTGTIDGRLIAIDRATGESVWDVNTIDLDKPYSITGAPRVVQGLVIIGNGGAEFGVRGYVSAYDADTGELKWRFHTVPGNPSDGAESAAMEMAAKTWKGQWWELGGGGTVWDSMAYDPQLNLLYIGVGNGSPWNQQLRSPGGGDNLFLSSIVALRPATGEFVWHYQTTPGETWDYTATQHMILADLEIGGQQRKVIMQAPKNGFFYVLDRATGEFLSASNYVPVNWASHIDPQTGRPVELPGARWPGKAPHVQLPGPFGGHNWHPMSFSPATGLVYIPTHEVPFAYADDPAFEYTAVGWNTGADMALASLPSEEAAIKALRSMVKGRLVAWNPATQKAAWSVEHSSPWNGGTLATAGGLVFQGTGDAHFAAYDASSGESLWRFFSQTGIVAAPISYSVDGDQYVAVAAGWGGSFVLAYGGVLPSGSVPVGRVLVFKLGAKGQLPDIPQVTVNPVAIPESTASEAIVAMGRDTYSRRCNVCHGDAAVSSGLIPNLRNSAFLISPDAWKSVVHEGALAARGMPNFGPLLDADTVEAVRHYVIAEANDGLTAEQYRQINQSPND